MKALAYIFSIMVFLLSIAPCCTLEEHSQLLKEKSGISQHVPQDDCCQDCSPFFTCGNCGSFMLATFISFSTPTPSTLSPILNAFYLQPSVEGIDQSIWQPPKLS